MYLHKTTEPTHFSFIAIITDIRQIKVNGVKK